MVMEPTARSPPNFCRLELKEMESRLSVEIITKPEIPRARMPPTIRPSSFMPAGVIFRMDFLPRVRNSSTHRAPTAWLRTVARAAPRTPIFRPKMKMGSRTMLMPAPMTVVIMAMVEKPWEVR